MKKASRMIVVVVVCAAMLSACSKKHGCPAYGKVYNVPVEQQG